MSESDNSSMSDWGDSGMGHVTGEGEVQALAPTTANAPGGGMSMMGRPNMEASLGNGGGEASGMEASGWGSMSGVGPVSVNPAAKGTGSDDPLGGGSIMGTGWLTGNDGGGAKNLLDDDDDSPPLPMHSAEELTIGSKVWLCGAADFATIMKADMCAELVPLTHGNAVGIVKRHTENTTFVQFEAQPGTPDIVMGMSLARQGLSLKKIEPKKVKYVYKDKFGGGGDFGGNVGDLGPKGGRTNNNKSDGTEALTVVDHYVAAAGLEHSSPDRSCSGPVSSLAPAPATPAVLARKESVALALYKKRDYTAALDKLSMSVVGHAQRKSELASSMAQSQATGSMSPDRRVSIGSVLQQSSEEADEFGMTEKEALIWRAGCRLKLGELDGALEDALKCIETDADWAPGYVRSAEVYVAQGKHGPAKGLLDQAAFLNQGLNTGLSSLIETHEALARIDSNLSKRGLNLTVNGETVKRLVAKRRFEKGDVLLCEQPSCWVPTMANEANLCAHTSTVIPKGTGIAPPNPKLDDMYCSSIQAAKEVAKRYRDYESTLGAKATFAANFVIRDRANSVTNLEQLEVAQLAMRAFHCLVVMAKERAHVTVDPTTREVKGSFPKPFSVVPELQQLGLLPTPNPETPLDPKTRGDVGTLWNILTAQFSQAEKDAFPVKLFNDIYMGCKEYSVRYEVKSDATGNKLRSTLMLFPTLGALKTSVDKKESKGPVCELVEVVATKGAAERSNGGEREWELVALATIEPQTKL